MKYNTATILSKVRELMKNPKFCPKNIAAYIITMSDAHNSEYTAPYDKRIQYISKFTGSAGTCVVTQEKALLWTDGRYFLQAERQLDENWTLMKKDNPGVPTLTEWLTTHLPEGSIIGTDPLLVSYRTWKNISTKLVESNRELVAIDQNLVDYVWKADGKEDLPYSNIFVYPIEYAGISWEEKIKSVRKHLGEEGVDLLFLSCLDSICWLFNLRGSDIEHCPVFKSYAIISNSTVDLFLNVKELPLDVFNHLKSDDSTLSVNVHPYHNVVDHMKLMSTSNNKLWITDDNPAIFSLNVNSSNLFTKECPISIMKSIKNITEQEGIRKACIRDSAALCQYFGFLEDEIGKRYLTELSAAEHLYEIRKKMDKFYDLSFTTISSTGANCAIIHYNPKDTFEEVIIDPDSIYLCDSGGQYWDGTTDITRTLHYGKPTPQEILAFTMVLKGHINLARCIFPENIKGHSLDAIARVPLWSYGLDYLHGTGHGIGSFLNVHEGPQSISGKAVSDYELHDGMLLSNEPGYYENGKFGIRIENMMFVQEKKDIANNFNGNKYFFFDTVSLVPIQQKLIDVSLLSKDEVNWLNDYHKKCYDLVSPILKQMNMTQGLRWLEDNTNAIV